MNHESIEGIFLKIINSFNDPLYNTKNSTWVFNNLGNKIPGTFWALWKKYKEIIKDAGFGVVPLQTSPQTYEIIFKTTNLDVNFEDVVKNLKAKIEGP